MENNYAKVKEYLLNLEYNIVNEDLEDEVFVIEREDDGIVNMVIAIADPIVIIEQQLFTLKDDNAETLKSLMMKNRDIIHGAMVLDETGKNVIFRDTLQVENLDSNEIEASIESLSLLLSEYSAEIMKFAK